MCRVLHGDSRPRLSKPSAAQGLAPRTPVSFLVKAFRQKIKRHSAFAVPFSISRYRYPREILRPSSKKSLRRSSDPPQLVTSANPAEFLPAQYVSIVERKRRRQRSQTLFPSTDTAAKEPEHSTKLIAQLDSRESSVRTSPDNKIRRISRPTALPSSTDVRILGYSVCRIGVPFEIVFPPPASRSQLPPHLVCNPHDLGNWPDAYRAVPQYSDRELHLLFL